jgi:hypothetical protein
MGLEITTAVERVELKAPTDCDRAAALAHWRAGPRMAGADEAALAEATRLSRILATCDGPAFDSVVFAELVEFIEELPF